MTPSQLIPGLSLSGIEPDRIVQVVAAVPVGQEAVTLIYSLPDGAIRERLLTAADFATITPATAERPWSFDGDGKDFKLAVEAKRIHLAFLFNLMMANVDTLPHQAAHPFPFPSRC